jgi:hypothetical protein
LTPPSATQFYLDRDSLAFADPVAHGIDPASLDQQRPAWLAPSLGDGRVLQWVSFEPLDHSAHTAWDEVRETVARWHSAWRGAKAAGLAAPLGWQDGGDWSRIIDARGTRARIYTLDGIVDMVLRACAAMPTRRALHAALPSLSPPAIDAALDELVAERLVLAENEHYLLVAPRAVRLR